MNVISFLLSIDKFVFFLVLCAMVSASQIQAADVDSSDYKLVWADEFERPGRPDEGNWVFEEGFKRNQELQWYQPQNAWVENGLLIIEGRRERVPNPSHDPGSGDWKRSRAFGEYTSASLNTAGKHAWLYGRFEIRAKIEASSGLWPAIWTLGSAREWPACGEIDIMEFYDGKIHANACWGSRERWKGIWDSVATPIRELGDDEWDEQFHVWRMDWDEQAIRLYVDDRLLNTIELDKTTNQSSDGANPFREPHYALLNLAIGGPNGGDPSRTSFPSRYLVDYVRVYQRMR